MRKTPDSRNIARWGIRVAIPHSGGNSQCCTAYTLHNGESHSISLLFPVPYLQFHLTPNVYPHSISLFRFFLVAFNNLYKFTLHYIVINRDKAKIKEKVIKMIEELPEDITVSDVMAELYFRQNVDEGLKELDEGKGISHEEAKKRLSRLTHGARLLPDDLVEGGF